MVEITPDAEVHPPLGVSTHFVPDPRSLELFAAELERWLAGEAREPTDLPRQLYRAFGRYGALRVAAWRRGQVAFAATGPRTLLVLSAMMGVRAALEHLEAGEIDAFDFCWVLRPYRLRRKETQVSRARPRHVAAGLAAGVLGDPETGPMACPLDLVMRATGASLGARLTAEIDAVLGATQGVRSGPTLHLRLVRAHEGGWRALPCYRGSPVLEGTTFLELHPSKRLGTVFSAAPPWLGDRDAPARDRGFSAYLQGRGDPPTLGAKRPVPEQVAWCQLAPWLLPESPALARAVLTKLLKRSLGPVLAHKSREVNARGLAAVVGGLVALEGHASGAGPLKGSSRDAWRKLAEHARGANDPLAASALMAALAATGAPPGGLAGAAEALVALLLEHQRVDPQRLDTCGLWASERDLPPLAALLITSEALVGLRYALDHGLYPSGGAAALWRASTHGLRGLCAGLRAQGSRGHRIDADDPQGPTLALLAMRLQSLSLAGDAERADASSPLSPELSGGPQTGDELRQISFAPLTYDFDIEAQRYRFRDRVQGLDWLPREGAEPYRSGAHFQRLARGVDISPMLEELRAREAFFGVDTSRQRNTLEQAQTETIYIRAAWPQSGLRNEDAHGIRYTRSTVAFPVIHGWVQRVCAALDLLPGRLVVARLRGHGEVMEHYDSGQFSCFWSRFHLVLVSEGSHMHSGGESRVFLPGDFFWFDNEAAHRAENPGSERRIHVIFDARPRELPMPPDASTRLPETAGDRMPAPALPLGVER